MQLGRTRFLIAVAITVTLIGAYCFFVMKMGSTEHRIFFFEEQHESARQQSYKLMGVATLLDAPFSLIMDVIPSSLAPTPDLYKNIHDKLIMSAVPMNYGKRPLEDNNPIIYLHFQQSDFGGRFMFETVLEVLQPIATLRPPHYVTVDRTWASRTRVGLYADTDQDRKQMKDLIDACVDEFIEAYLQSSNIKVE